MTETTLTPAPDDVIEYGYADRTDAAIRWPDEDGELYVGTDYYPAVGLGERELTDLRRKVSRLSGKLYERTVSRSAARPVAEPLPAVGSIARADVVSPVYGDLGRQTVRRSDLGAFPWTLVGESRFGAGIPADGATDVAVVFDAATGS